MVICPSIGARNHANKWYFRVPKQALDLLLFFLFFRSLNNHFHSKVIGGEKGALNLQKDILKLTILAKRLTKSFPISPIHLFTISNTKTLEAQD